MTNLRIPTVLRLAFRDLKHGWQSTACLILAVAVALIPLLLLYGLKYGVVTNLIDSLTDDPRTREITLVKDQPLSAEWFDELGGDERVAFLLPRARYLASSVRVRGPNARKRLEARMIPSAGGDPLLMGLPIPTGLAEIVMTERSALETGASVGDAVTLEVLRIVGDKSQTQRPEATIIGILPRDLLQTDDIFVSPLLESSIERWREGFAVPELGWEGVDGTLAADAEGRQFASFRLYTRDVRDVPGLRSRLLADGLDVETRAEQIETTLAIEAGLGWVFLAVSVLSVGGFLLTLGLHLAASVVEKARELALLRLLGLESAELSLVPSVQGVIIAGVGAVLAILVTIIAQPLVNSQLTGLAGLNGDVSRLQPVHYLIAVIAAVLAGGISGCVAGFRAATLEPTKGLRRD